MNLTEDDLRWAARENLITETQADSLWRALVTRATGQAPKPRFDLVHVAYYFGALIVVAAMGFFMTLGWESFGGGGIFAIASAYALVFVLVGQKLLGAEATKIPGGLLVTMAVCMTPLAMYGLERALGLWPANDPGHYRDFHAYIKAGWLWMELATVCTSAVALYFVAFPFLTAPPAFVLWYMSMDLAPLLFGRDLDWNERALVSVAVGVVMLVVAFIIDRKTRDDYAFWLYLFGLFAFSGGLSTMESGSQLHKAVYALIHLGLIAVSAPLGRRAFLVVGALGVTGYLGNLSWTVFKDSVAFPFVLSSIGLLILFSAVKYARHRAAIDARMNALVPAWLRKQMPGSR